LFILFLKNAIIEIKHIKVNIDMIKLSEKALIIPDEMRNEVLIGIILNKFVFENKDFIIGDDPKNRLTDMYTTDKKIGVQITQTELDCDLDAKIIGKLNEKVNGNANLLREEIRRVYSKYNGTIVDENNKVIGWNSEKCKVRTTGYLSSTYERIIKKS
jgi:hypothetical protein